MKSAGNRGVVQSRLQMLHVHVFLAAPPGASYMAQPRADPHQGGTSVRECCIHNTSDFYWQIDFIIVFISPIMEPLVFALEEAAARISAKCPESAADKNAVLKGTNYLDGATMRERNQQIGGHKAK